MPEIIKLATQLDKARDHLFELAQNTRSPGKKAEIAREMRRLSRETRRLISINIKKRGEEYDAATSALGTANTRLRKAIDDSQKLADALEQVAFALDLVAKVKPA